jgi:NitT/TauT family transport system substrate-binding protein
MYKPQEAYEMAVSAGLKEKMKLVREFCFNHSLLGSGTKSPDDIAIKYPDGSVQGKQDRVRMRFDASYMQLAAGGKL